MTNPIIECVPNFSEGRNPEIIRQITSQIEKIKGVKLLNVDAGKGTNRTVVTFVGDPDSVIEAAFRAIKKASEIIDMRNHKGEHPRMGATDVCPLVPISGISMEETVEYAHRLRYFDKIGERYAVRQALKDLVQFDLHNLKTEFLPQHNDIIFCRNFLIRLDDEEKKRLIEKFHRCLNPGGYLFVGQAESLFGLTEKFRMIHQNNGTAYQRIEKAV